LTFNFDLWPEDQGHTHIFLIRFSFFNPSIILGNLWQNWWSRSGYIAKWNCWAFILTFTFRVKVTTFYSFNYHFMFNKHCNNLENRSSRSGFNAKWNIWSLIWTFDHVVNITQFCFQIAFYGYYLIFSKLFQTDQVFVAKWNIKPLIFTVGSRSLNFTVLSAYFVHFILHILTEFFFRL